MAKEYIEANKVLTKMWNRLCKEEDDFEKKKMILRRSLKKIPTWMLANGLVCSVHGSKEALESVCKLSRMNPTWRQVAGAVCGENTLKTEKANTLLLARTQTQDLTKSLCTARTGSALSLRRGGNWSDGVLRRCC